VRNTQVTDKAIRITTMPTKIETVTVPIRSCSEDRLGVGVSVGKTTSARRVGVGVGVAVGVAVGVGDGATVWVGENGVGLGVGVGARATKSVTDAPCTGEGSPSAIAE
jgi:hypothetical protein